MEQIIKTAEVERLDLLCRKRKKKKNNKNKNLKKIV